MKKKPCERCGSTNWYGLHGAPGGGWAGCTECLEWTPTHPNWDMKAHKVLMQNPENVKHLKDTTPPHTYDKLTKKMVPNPEFIKAFPQNARQWFRPQELKDAGYGKLAKTVQKQRDNDGVSRDLGGSISTE